MTRVRGQDQTRELKIQECGLWIWTTGRSKISWTPKYEDRKRVQKETLKHVITIATNQQSKEGWIEEEEKRAEDVEGGQGQGQGQGKGLGEMWSPHDGAEALSGDDVPPLGVVNGEILVRRALTMAAAAHPSPSHSPDRPTRPKSDTNVGRFL